MYSASRCRIGGQNIEELLVWRNRNYTESKIIVHKNTTVLINYCTCRTFKCSIPQPPLLGSFTNLYFLGRVHPDTSQAGGALGVGGVGDGIHDAAPLGLSGSRPTGIEKVKAGVSGLLEEIQRNVVGIMETGAGTELSSASGSASSSSTAASADFLPLGRDCFFSSRLIVSAWPQEDC